MCPLSLEIQTNTDHIAVSSPPPVLLDRQDRRTRPGHGARPPSRAHVRASTARMLDLAQHLLPHEASMIHAVYGRGLNVGALADTLKLPTRAVRRQLDSLVRRLNSPTFAMVIAQRHTWPATLRQVATEHFILGRDMKTIQRMTGLSYGQVRRQRDALLTMAATWQATRIARLGGPVIPAATGDEP